MIKGKIKKENWLRVTWESWTSKEGQAGGNYILLPFSSVYTFFTKAINITELNKRNIIGITDSPLYIYIYIILHR